MAPRRDDSMGKRKAENLEHLKVQMRDDLTADSMVEMKVEKTAALMAESWVGSTDQLKADCSAVSMVGPRAGSKVQTRDDLTADLLVELKVEKTVASMAAS